MVIRYDRSSWSVVAWCSCGWRELCVTQDGAWRVAKAHETAQHPDRFQVRHAEAQRRRDQSCPRPGESEGSGGTLEQW